MPRPIDRFDADSVRESWDRAAARHRMRKRLSRARQRHRLTGYAWLIRAGTSLPAGLKLVNDTPGHYMLAPVKNMPLDMYKGLLEEMGTKCEKYLQIKKDGTMVRFG